MLLRTKYLIGVLIITQLSLSLSALGQKVIQLHPDLKLTEITPHVYLHVSNLNLENGEKIPCNGLVYIYGGEALIFDTPVNDSLSNLLISWIEDSMSFKINGVIVNHFHNDCLGGLQAMHDHGISSYASFRTIKLARENELPVPHHGFETALNMRLGKRIISNRYCGPAHSQDNIVSYLPQEKILFGGCMIRTVAYGKGNLEDASPEAWTIAVDRILRAYPNIEIVIPGHGEPGGKELLYYTMDLFRN